MTNSESQAEAGLLSLFTKDILTPICAATDSLDHLLHGCSPCHTHHPILHLGGHFLDGRVAHGRIQDRLTFYPVDLIPSPPGLISRTGTLYGESLSKRSS